MNRRRFLGMSASAALGLALGSRAESAAKPMVKTQLKIPRWRGFNLTELTGGRPGKHFQESDFEWMASWGFNFARLPLSYWVWADRHNWKQIDESAIAPIDQAIAWGKQYKIHINICLHRIPGYCVNGREAEPFQLFDSPRESMEKALDAAVFHWRYFANRYRDIGPERLSFDLFNEPPFMADQSRYVEIAKALIGAIREVSPGRLIVADGADIGQTPVLGLIDEGIVQSTRGYQPKMVSHYTAKWVPKNEFESFEKPTWPMRDAKGTLWDRDKLREVLINPWRPLIDRGVPIHVGEWGCHNATPHPAMLGWFKDMMAVWKEVGWGWSMWNLRGGFGVVDSGRADVKYEDFHGHKLDRELLELLLAN